MITIQDIDEVIDSLNSQEENRSAYLLGARQSALAIRDIANEQLDDEEFLNKCLRSEIDDLRSDVEELEDEVGRIKGMDTLKIDTLLDVQRAEVCKRMFDELTLDQLTALERFAHRSSRFTTTDKSIIDEMFSKIK